MAQCICSRLSAAPLMAGVDSDVISRISAAGRLMSLKGRFGRLQPDELSRSLFFVLSGEMRMFQVAPDGQEHLIQRFGAGEFYCLAALISGHSCNSFVVNVGRTELLHWNHDQFRRFLDDNPGFYGNVLSQIAHQLERERELRTLSRCCRADVKVAAYLLHRIRSGQCLCQRGCAVDLRPITLTAQELGIARETLSRCLQRLVRREGISYQRGMISVNDISSLEAVLDESECSCGYCASAS
jgi:CRP-like cAMP-binding protein